jgi:hypothetical protein
MTDDPTGINISPTEYVYWCGLFDPRIRQDTPGSRGTTPTKFKITLNQFFAAPKVHVSSDIPLSVAKKQATNLIGKPVYMYHDEDEQYGYIAFATVNMDPKTYPYITGDEMFSSGKKITFFDLTGVIGIRKDKISEILNETEKSLSIEELNLSISYVLDWKIDPEDRHINKDGSCNWKKTKVYARRFRFQEVSLIDRGHNMKRGARILMKMSKETSDQRYGFSSSDWNFITNNGRILNDGISSASSNAIRKYMETTLCKNGPMTKSFCRGQMRRLSQVQLKNRVQSYGDFLKKQSTVHCVLPSNTLNSIKKIVV